MPLQPAPQAGPQQLHSLARGGRCEPTAQGSRDLLRALPRGAYTAALALTRPEDPWRFQVPGWRLHCERLRRSWELIAADEGLAGLSGQQAAALPRTVSQRAHEALQAAAARLPAGEAHSLALILHVSALGQAPGAAGELGVTAHASLLPAATHPVQAGFMVAGGRALPEAKDSRWVEARAPLEAAGPSGPGTQLLLGSADGRHLLEGLTSSLFVVRGVEGGQPVLQTARDGVLAGVMAALVKEVAEAHGVASVREEALDSWERRAWSEAFATNGLRGIIPFQELHGRRGEEGPAWQWTSAEPAPGPVTRQLQGLLEGAMEAAASIEGFL